MAPIIATVHTKRQPQGVLTSHGSSLPQKATRGAAARGGANRGGKKVSLTRERVNTHMNVNM